MNYSVFGKYAYIYWIPIFPAGKENVLECNNCKRTYKLKELPEQIKHKFEIEKHKGIPLKHFTGIGIIILVLAWLSYTNSKDKENETLYIKNPLVGDVYSTKSDISGYYSTAKVVEVTKDSIYLMHNSFDIDQKYSTNEIDKAVNYDSENTEGFTLEEIKLLYKDETIYEIDRN
jgi:hypothetical protein